MQSKAELSQGVATQSCTYQASTTHQAPFSKQPHARLLPPQPPTPPFLTLYSPLPPPPHHHHHTHRDIFSVLVAACLMLACCLLACSESYLLTHQYGCPPTTPTHPPCGESIRLHAPHDGQHQGQGRQRNNLIAHLSHHGGQHAVLQQAVVKLLPECRQVLQERNLGATLIGGWVGIMCVWEDSTPCLSRCAEKAVTPNRLLVHRNGGCTGCGSVLAL